MKLRLLQYMERLVVKVHEPLRTKKKIFYPSIQNITFRFSIVFYYWNFSRKVKFSEENCVREILVELSIVDRSCREFV